MQFRSYLQDHIVILDGGMGTLLQGAGLRPGELPERWNISHADEVTAIHRAYFDAGSNVVNTNTFGASPLKFSGEELEAVISAAVANARRAAAESLGTLETFVALDIGPTGKLLAPLGDMDFEDAVSAFAAVVRLGVKYGVDLVTVETMNDSYETKAALLAVKENCDLPVLVSCAFGADGKLMTGADPAAMVALLEGMGADAIGVNCSLGPDALAPVVREYLDRASIPVLLKPNAGLPTVLEGQTVYNVTPAEFARSVTDLVAAGVRVVGGCCGTTPAYIVALTTEIATRGLVACPISEKTETVISSYTHAVTFGDSPILIGERINPTGKKRFKQALLENDMDYILAEGLHQQEKGVHILDVNVGLPDIDEAEMLSRSVQELQAIINLPLQIDTADPDAMERALRRYNGKAMINSVNGKKESMEAIFPLVKKYGGVVVALTLDENGIPATAEGRFAIAQKILQTAAEYGVDKKDIIFDTLAMTVSADNFAAIATLEALKRIREELGCHTSLGVSNVSFGLPVRDAVNGVFFALALENRLSAAIMNPYSADMMKTYYAYRALKGVDPNCAEYIQASEGFAPLAPAAPAAEKTGAASEYASELQRAIGKGMREKASELTKTLLQSVPAMEIVQNEVIPALNAVGKGFENKTVYLPQLLMSAEAAKSAFEEIKAFMSESGGGSVRKGRFVLATVHGDIHDIGKNIVKLLLENYGFEVIDLGKDVPAETIVKAVVEQKAPLVGLSALMTTTVPAMEETIKQLRAEAPWCRVIVGGAVLNADYAAKIGADHYAGDAMETVRYAEEFFSK